VNQQSVTTINLFTPKPGKLDEFVEVQKAALSGFRGAVPGLQTSRFYRSPEAGTAVLISVFDTREHFERFRASELFAAHRERIAPLLAGASPGVYELVYRTTKVEHEAAAA
jgi:heme-degrading monooxygenase HmoA